MAENPPPSGGDRATGRGTSPEDGSAPDGGAAFPEGVPCWVEAQLPDVAAGRRFYGELFGWSFEEGPGNSAWAYRDGRSVAALAPKGDGRMPTVWTVYFTARDVVALAGRVRGAGGQVITVPTPVGALGTMALVADPEGAVFGLWQAGAHAGFGRRHEPGCFTWAELYARDTGTADSFYSGLFHDALLGPGTDPDFGRAPVTGVFPEQMPPHFLVHFGTRSVPAALDTVRRLGGRVQVPPFDTSYGRVTVLTDSQGASFALLER